MLQDGWRKALRSGCAGVLIKRPEAAGVFSVPVVSVSGKGGETTVTYVRSYTLLRQQAPLWHGSLPAKLIAVLAVMIVVAVLVVETELLSRIFRCLMGERCGPKRASGWNYLGGIGLWYMLFEAVGFALRRAGARLASVGARPESSSKPTSLRGAA